MIWDSEGNLVKLEGVGGSQWVFGMGSKGRLEGFRLDFRGPRVDLGVGFEGVLGIV